MAAKMAFGGVSRWRGRLLVAVSVPVLGAPFLSAVKAGSTKVHPRELEIYDPVVEQTQDVAKPAEEQITEIEQKVSAARKYVWRWTFRVKEGISQVRTTYSSVEEKSLEFWKLIQTDTTFQLKVGGISAAVVVGAVLAGRGRRPIRRIFYSAVLGTTAAAICYPSQAVDIALANYDKLKAFTKEQWHKFNQLRIEQADFKKLESSVEDTEISKDQDKPTENVAEQASVELKEDKKEVKEVREEVPEKGLVADSEEKPKASFWSNIPFLDKLIGSKESVTGSEASPVAVGEGEDAKESEASKDQVIVQQESISQTKILGDIGQSNPEDKDMYSKRS